jgi:hypothetical protein
MRISHSQIYSKKHFLSLKLASNEPWLKGVCQIEFISKIYKKYVMFKLEDPEIQKLFLYSYHLFPAILSISL